MAEAGLICWYRDYSGSRAKERLLLLTSGQVRFRSEKSGWSWPHGHWVVHRVTLQIEIRFHFAANLNRAVTYVFTHSGANKFTTSRNGFAVDLTFLRFRVSPPRQLMLKDAVADVAEEWHVI